MDILIEPSDYTHLNVGDMAMLQVALARLRKLWPEARLWMFADDPKQLATYYPDVLPLATSGRQTFFARRHRCTTATANRPDMATSWLRQVQRTLRHHLSVAATITTR